MEQKPYHHGNLRNKLIEAGIELISEEGVNHFSLRKVAVRCGVSHTAPYSHFENIEALKLAMGEYVTEKFAAALQAVVTDQKDHGAAVTSLGKAYISFFRENPHYFQFLFYHSGVVIDFDQEDQYPPLAVFQEAAYRLFADMGLDREDYQCNLLALWSMVHGVVSLLTNKRICYSGSWEDVLLKTCLPGGGIL